MTTKTVAQQLADDLEIDYPVEVVAYKSAAELRRLDAKNAEWEKKAEAWLASPEAATRLEGYRNLAQRLSAVEQQRDELLAALKSMLAVETVFDAEVAEANARATIAKVEGVNHHE